MKSFAIAMSSALLLQSCVVYSTTTLQDATEENIKTKIIHSEGKPSKYKFITQEGGEYFGVQKNAGELVKNRMDQENISKVKVKNKSASTLLTVGTILLPVSIIALSVWITVNPFYSK